LDAEFLGVIKQQPQHHRVKIDADRPRRARSNRKNLCKTISEEAWGQRTEGVMAHNVSVGVAVVVIRNIDANKSPIKT
jgi:hypothetical protein